MGKVIAISNGKGGVGKTTTSVQLVDILSSGILGTKYKVLGIGLDAQGNFESSFRRSKSESGLYDLAIMQVDNRIKINDFVDIITSQKVKLLPKELDDEIGKEFFLRYVLESYLELYDFIILDCPPATSLITDAAYVASDSIIIPITTDRYSIEGIAEMHQRVSTIRKMFQHNVKYEGILIVNANKNTNAFKDSLSDAHECARLLNSKVFIHSISSSTCVKEAQKAQRSLRDFAPHAKPTLEYIEFAREIIGEDI